jgi:hypothetical protein
MFNDKLILERLDALMVKINELVEIDRQNTQRLIRMETRMVKLMLALGLDQDGKKM